MQYIDSFTVKYKHCSFESLYPLESVLKYTADCQKCGQRLADCANEMHKNVELHRVSLWPTHFIFEGCEVLGLNIDHMTDE